MKAIDFKPARCSHCYRCVRTCGVKAITIKDQQAQILEDSCILCGYCLNECPQDAKVCLSDLDKVKKWIASGVTTVVSLAPSYRSFYRELDLCTRFFIRFERLLPGLYRGLRKLVFGKDRC